MASKWTEELVLSVINEARLAGKVCAEAKLAELTRAGPAFMIKDDMNKDKVVGALLDVCGNAVLKIRARGKFYLLAKKLSVDRSRRFHCTRGYYGGGRLNIFDSTMRQEMSVNVAACKGQQRVLEAYGIPATIKSQID